MNQKKENIKYMGEKEEKERILNQAAGAVPLLQLSYAIPYSTTPVLARPS